MTERQLAKRNRTLKVCSANRHHMNRLSNIFIKIKKKKKKRLASSVQFGPPVAAGQRRHLPKDSWFIEMVDFYFILLITICTLYECGEFSLQIQKASKALMQCSAVLGTEHPKKSN